MDWQQLATTVVTAIGAVAIGIYTFKTAIMRFLQSDNEFLKDAVKTLQQQRLEDKELIIKQGDQIIDLGFQLRRAHKRIDDLEAENTCLSTENSRLKEELKNTG